MAYLSDFPVIFAAEKGDTEKLRKLLKEGSDYKESNYAGVTPLQAAANGGHLECVKLLLEAARAEFSSSEKVFERVINISGALSIAANHGHWKLVEVLAPLYQGCSAETTGYALSAACHNNQIKCIDILVKVFPSHVNEIDGRCRLPVHVSAEFGNAHAMKLLENAGADLHAKTIATDETPFHLACKAGNTEVITFLLDKTDDIDVTSVIGSTPLFFAATRNHVQVVQILLSRGAKPCKVHGEYGNTCPLSSAAGSGLLDVVKILAEVANQECGARGVLNAMFNEHPSCLEYLLSENRFPTFLSSDYEQLLNPWNIMLYHSFLQYKDRSKIFEILIENDTQFQELAVIDPMCDFLGIFPARLMLIHLNNLKVFLDFGLAELQWADKQLYHLPKFMNETRESIRECVDQRDESIEEHLVSREIEDLLPKLRLYMKYIPYFRLPNDLSSTDIAAVDSFSQYVIPVLGSLKKLCRWSIRSCIVRVNGSVRTEHMKSLEVPNSVKGFLLFKNNL